MIFTLIASLFAVLSGFSPEMSIDFARHLENEKDYYRAITEYKRAYYELSDSGASRYLKDEVAYSIVRLSEKLKDYSTARFFLDRIQDKQSQNFKFQEGLWYFLQENYEEARKKWGFSDTLVAWTYLREQNFDKASYVFGIIRPAHRSPLLASFLSSLVPGLGKVYAGRAYDGLYSFIINAGSFYLAYDAYKNNRKPEVYLYSAMFIFFYSGNVYGSWIAAREYNRYHIKLAITEKEISLGLWQLLP